MTITVAQTIQYDDATSGTSHQKTSISTTAGRRLVLAIGSAEPGGATSVVVTGVTDSAGNTWAEVVNANGFTSPAASIWATGNNASAITSFTITLAHAGTVQSQFYELTNTDVIDKTATATGVSTSADSGATATPAGATDVAIGVIAVRTTTATYSSVTFTSGAGTEVTRSSSSGSCRATTGSLILSSATGQGYSATISSLLSWCACVALWKAAASGPAGLKTFNGLAKASIKTINGVPIASVKTVNGLA